MGKECGLYIKNLTNIWDIDDSNNIQWLWGNVFWSNSLMKVIATTKHATNYHKWTLEKALMRGTFNGFGIVNLGRTKLHILMLVKLH
jgi:hypothetical protein